MKRRSPADLKKIEPLPNSEVVADAMRRMIALGRFGPGDVLPTQRALATQLGVGRMTLRAAIRQMEEEGLLITTLGRSGGTVVVGHQAPLRTQKKYIKKYISELRENYEFRLAVEPHAAMLCAERANQKERANISRIAYMQVDSLTEYRLLDSQFHAAIAESCGNRLMHEALHNARTDFFIWADMLLMEEDAFVDDMESSITQHRAIADAVSDGAPSRAWHEMVAHLHDTKEKFASQIGDAKLLNSIVERRKKTTS